MEPIGRRRRSGIMGHVMALLGVLYSMMLLVLRGILEGLLGG